jgi:hypothetical protein
MSPAPIACLNCHVHIEQSRGLCGACYTTLCQLVRSGKATWAQLEVAGRCRATKETPWRTWHNGETTR